MYTPDWFFADTHDVLKNDERELAAERDKQLKKAMLYREFCINEIEALYNYECKNANQTFTNAMNTSKEKILADINATAKRMEALRDGILETTGGDNGGMLVFRIFLYFINHEEQFVLASGC